MKKLYSLLLATGLLAASSASAALLVYDGFDYATGPLDGQNGGSGNWTGSWSSQLGVTSGSLPYENLSTSGNKATDGSGSSATAFRSFDTTGLFGDGTSLWFSLTFDVTSSGSDARVKFFGDRNDAISYQTGVGLLLDGDGDVNIEYNGTRVDSSVAYTKGVENIVVGRFDFSDTDDEDRILFWLNPDLDSMPSDGSASANVAGGNFELEGSDVVIRGGGSFTGSIDELRLGNSYADVTPVPEPSTYAFFIGIAALALARLRRK